MKRIITLSLILSLVSTLSFAQIRIEKRHYNKGWYVSVNHKKNLREEKSEADKNLFTEKMIPQETSTATAEKPLTELSVVAEKPVATVPENKMQKNIPAKISAEKVKSIAGPVAKEVKTLVVKPVQMEKSFAQKTLSKTAAKADPGDSFLSYLGDSLGEALLYSLLIVAGLGLVVYLLSLVVSPGAAVGVGAGIAVFFELLSYC